MLYESLEGMVVMPVNFCQIVNSTLSAWNKFVLVQIASFYDMKSFEKI